MNLASKEKVIRNKDKGNFLIRYIKSFFHAVDGIIYTVKNEHNLIIMILATIVVAIAGLHYSISVPEWLFCIGIIGAVIASEMINTAIEAVVDLVSPEKHILAKIAKDTASSASLVLSITAFIGALIIFIPKIF